MFNPTTAQDWQLYTSNMNCTVAARALTAALKRAKVRAVAIYRKGGVTPESAAYKAMREVMYPTMNKYADKGACDTEPRGVAVEAIEKHLESIFPQ